MALRQSGFARAILSVPINNAIYEYLVGTITDTQTHREELLNSAELTSDAATQVFNEYSAAVHQIVRIQIIESAPDLVYLLYKLLVRLAICTAISI